MKLIEARDIFMNEVVIEEESKINRSLDFETKRNLQFNKEGIMHQCLKK
jgi:hypothetical protein